MNHSEGRVVGRTLQDHSRKSPCSVRINASSNESTRTLEGPLRTKNKGQATKLFEKCNLNLFMVIKRSKYVCPVAFLPVRYAGKLLIL